MLFGFGRKLDVVVVKAKCAVEFHDEVDYADYLALDLVGHAVDVGVVLGELAYADEAVHLAAGLIAVDQAKLGYSHREFAVGMLSRFVDEQPAGAVHRLDRVVDVVDGGKVHILFIVVPVAALVPELLVENDGRFYLVIAVFAMNGPPEVDDLVPDYHPLGVEEGETGAGLVEAEEVHLLAEEAVVAFFGFFESVEVACEVLFVSPGGPVDPLEHLFVSIAVPIGSGDGHYLEAADL